MLQIPQIDITVKFKGAKNAELFCVKNAHDAAEVCRMVFDADKIEWLEEAVLICLNKANKVVGWYKVSSGGMTGTVVDPKVVYTVALNSMATSIIICHNHPSGGLKPSNADELLTQKIKDAGKLLDIRLLDHIILTKDSFFSFADDGLLNQ